MGQEFHQPLIYPTETSNTGLRRITTLRSTTGLVYECGRKRL